MDLADIRDVAVRMLVELSIAGLDKERTEKAETTKQGAKILLFKLVGETRTADIVKEAEEQFQNYCLRIKREDEKKNAYEALLRAIRKIGEPEEVFDWIEQGRGDLQTIAENFPPGTVYEGLHRALYAFDNSLARAYGPAYTSFIEAQSK